MVMMTTLARCQAPIFGIGSSVLETRIGADQRTVWMRPITAGPSQTELLPVAAMQSAERVTPPISCSLWINQLSDQETGSWADQQGG